MKPSLQPGVSMTRRITIDRDRTIGFMGEDARVYATPSMIMDMETDLPRPDHAARRRRRGFGRHRGRRSSIWPRRLTGMTVEIAVRVAAVEGRKVTFEVSAKDELEAIGAGTHARFVVDTAKTVERLKAKAARARRAEEIAQGFRLAAFQYFSRLAISAGLKWQ